ncbi:tetratricopeptide repeat protein [Actinoplanes sp. NPDC049802]|uniref:tetratricopeptide repeat protein n=1 Tax=Actinoplanes sp. NPDC049802 TaxID=3154742 RepID=UPI003410FE99
MSRWSWRWPAPDLPTSPGSSVTIGGDSSGVVSAGADALIIQQAIENGAMVPAEALTPVAEVPAPAGMCHLPMADGLLLGRGEELRLLDAAVADPLVLVQAVHGLGGIGKSTLVAHWAAGHRDRFAPVWWITADSAAGVDAGLVAFAGALQPGLSQVLPSEALRERALGWLAVHAGWLLVLDNVTDPGDLAGLFARVAPDRVGGRMVLTSRRATGWPRLVSTLRLDVLPVDAAVELLTGLAARDGVAVDRVEAEAVCTVLGLLPLAVEQAGAYMAETGTGGRDYLRLWETYPADMFRDGGENRRAERTVARIWRVTLDALRAGGDDLPERLLRVLAWYAPDDIARGLVDGIGEGEPATRRALGRLAAYNMITLNAGVGTISVHRLVQAVARTPDSGDPYRQADDITAAHMAALRALAAVLPDWQDPAEWPRWRRLLPHLNAATRSASQAADNDLVTTTAFLNNRHGLFLEGQGDVRAAILLFEQALADRRRVLGDDHPDTLTSVNNLAGAYRSAGDLGRAIGLFEQALADRRRILGDDHPDTLTSVNNLAYAYRSAGDLGRAIPLFEQALADRRRVLGDDHPNTLTSVNNLAYAYRSAGDLGRAIPLFEQALADRRRVLGDDHPDTLTSVNNLAGACQAAGGLGRAIPLYEQALAVSGSSTKPGGGVSINAPMPGGARRRALPPTAAPASRIRSRRAAPRRRRAGRLASGW